MLLEPGQDFRERSPMSKQKLQHIGNSAGGKDENHGTEPESKAIKRIKLHLLSRAINDCLGSIHNYPLRKCLIEN
jgi:hypothetical protein